MAKREPLAAAITKGAVAGAVGTAAMTAVSTIEAKLRDRGASTAPADAAEKLLGIEPRSEEAEQRLSNLVHYLYGTAWGAFRGAVAALGLRGAPADAAHFGTVWGSAALMLPALDIAPPMKKWGAKEVAIDAFHHAVYAGATGIAFRLMARR